MIAPALSLVDLTEAHVALLVRNEERPMSYREALQTVADQLGFGVRPADVAFYVSPELREALTSCARCGASTNGRPGWFGCTDPDPGCEA